MIRRWRSHQQEAGARRPARSASQGASLIQINCGDALRPWRAPITHAWMGQQPGADDAFHE